MKTRRLLFLMCLSAFSVLLLVGCEVLQNLATRQSTTTSDNATAGGGLPPRFFRLLTPLNGATDVSLTPTLQWEPSIDPEGGSIQYTVRVTTNEGMSKVTTVVQTSYSLTTPLQPSTTYYWQVEARDPAGNTRRTPYFSFTTGSGGTGGGEGNGSSPFAQTGVRKGVILHNPANPGYLVYVYIN
jgi:hypothetical protein